MAESIRDIICNNLSFGVTTVHPNRATKNCRIRKLLIEYYINDFTTILVIPRSCSRCPKMDDCTDEFIFQIIEKSNPDKRRGNEPFIL
jgi:hypothetical protein